MCGSSFSCSCADAAETSGVSSCAELLPCTELSEPAASDCETTEGSAESGVTDPEPLSVPELPLSAPPDCASLLSAVPDAAPVLSADPVVSCTDCVVPVPDVPVLSLA